MNYVNVKLMAYYVIPENNLATAVKVVKDDQT